MKTFKLNSQRIHFFLMVVFFLSAISSSPLVFGETSKKEQTKIKKDILDSKIVRKIYKKQGKRLNQINEYKKNNYVGETTTGLLAIRTTKGLSAKETDQLNKVVKAENKDRDKIISLIKRTNKYNVKEEIILRESMFKSRIDVDPIGTYYLFNTYWQKK